MQMMHSGHRKTSTAIVEQIKKRGETKVINNNSTEVVPQSLVDRITRLEKLFANFEQSGEFMQPRAFQELWERVSRLEQDPQTFVAAEPAELRDDLKELAKTMAEIGNASFGQLGALEEKLTSIETKIETFFEVIERG